MPYQLEESEIKHPPYSMIYNQHAAEISCQELFGDPEPVDWESQLDAMMLDGDDGLELYITIPAGWKADGWQSHFHKDAAWVVSFFLERDAEYGDCRICAAAPDW